MITITLYIIVLIAISIYVSLEVLRKYLRLDEVNQKSKELMKKVKNLQKLDEETLKEVLEIQKQMYKYMILSSLLLIGVLVVLTTLLGKEKVLVLPFTIPILNRNWLGVLGTYILCYFIISLIGGVVKKIYKSFVKKKANGEKNSNTENSIRKNNSSNKES